MDATLSIFAAIDKQCKIQPPIPWTAVRADVPLRLIMNVCAVVLIGLLVWAVQGPATARSAQPSVDDPPLVRVIDHGGRCAGGQECSTETVMLADGTVSRQSAGDVAVSYPVTPEQIGQLASLIASADGPVTLAGCQVQIDHAAPHIALVDAIVETGKLATRDRAGRARPLGGWWSTGRTRARRRLGSRSGQTAATAWLCRQEVSGWS